MKVNPLLFDASIYPFSFDMPARFADLDVQMHLNNARITELYQEARVAFYRRVKSENPEFMRPEDSRFLVAHMAIDYLAEVNYPQIITLRTGVLKIGRTSQTLLTGLFIEDRCAGLARVVLVNAGPQGPAAISDTWRAVLSKYQLPVEIGE